MKINKKLISGILYSASGSFWWGIIGVIYFKLVSDTGHVELVVHRTIWTLLVLIISISIFSRWKKCKGILNNKKKNIPTIYKWNTNFY